MKAFSIYLLMLFLGLKLTAQQTQNFRKNHVEILLEAPIGITPLDDLYDAFEANGFTRKKMSFSGGESNGRYPSKRTDKFAIGINYWRDINSRSKIGIGFHKFNFGSVYGVTSEEADYLDSRSAEFSMESIYINPSYTYNLWKPLYVRGGIVFLFSKMEDLTFKDSRQDFSSKFSPGVSGGINLRFWDHRLFTFTIGTDYILVINNSYGPLESNKGYRDEGEAKIIPERDYNFSHLKLYIGLGFNF